jgi:hypothetical protein
MTENSNGSEVGSQNLGTNTVTSTPAASQPAAEKMLPQSHVNDLVGRTKHESYEKGKQDAVAEWQKQNNVAPSQPTPNTGQQSSGNMPQMSQADLDKLVTDKVNSLDQQRQQQTHDEYWRKQGQDVATEINKKLADGRTRYEDYDTVVTPDVVKNIPEIAFLANSFDNTADVMYDVIKDSEKLIQIEGLLKTAKEKGSQFHQNLAFERLKNLSNSIKANKAAAENQPHIKEPLSQIKPSNVGAGNGSNTIATFKNNPKYRG